MARKAKKRPSRIFISKRGKKYILLNGKKIRLNVDPTISQRQLVRVVINNFRRQTKRKKRRNITGPGLPGSYSSSSGSSDARADYEWFLKNMFIRRLEDKEREIKGEIIDRRAHPALPAPPAHPALPAPPAHPALPAPVPIALPYEPHLRLDPTGRELKEGNLEYVLPSGRKVITDKEGHAELVGGIKAFAATAKELKERTKALEDKEKKLEKKELKLVTDTFSRTLDKEYTVPALVKFAQDRKLIPKDTKALRSLKLTKPVLINMIIGDMGKTLDSGRLIHLGTSDLKKKSGDVIVVDKLLNKYDGILKAEAKTPAKKSPAHLTTPPSAPVKPLPHSAPKASPSLPILHPPKAVSFTPSPPPTAPPSVPGKEDKEESDEDDVEFEEYSGPDPTESTGSGYIKGGLWNDQIEAVMKRYKNKGFKGVYSSDELTKVPVGNKIGFVVNLSKAKEKGTHWVAIYIDANRDRSVEYYDSFGKEPPPEIMKGVKKIISKINPDTYLKFKVNRIKQQSVQSSNCGWFAMKFLTDRLEGIPFKDCSGYSDVIKGEKDIKKFKNKILEFGYI